MAATRVENCWLAETICWVEKTKLGCCLDATKVVKTNWDGKTKTASMRVENCCLAETICWDEKTKSGCCSDETIHWVGETKMAGLKAHLSNNKHR